MPRRDDAMFYQLYFQTPGVAEAELQRDVRATIAKLLYSASGDVPHRAGAGGGSDISMVSHGGGFLARMLSPDVRWRGSATLISTSIPASSRGSDFAAASTGSATSTAIGSC